MRDEPDREDERFEIRENTANDWVRVADISVQNADCCPLPHKFPHDQIALSEKWEIRFGQAEAKRVEPFKHHAAMIHINKFSVAQIIGLRRITDFPDVVGCGIQDRFGVADLLGY